MANELIRIRGDLVEHVDERVMRQTRLSDFVETLNLVKPAKLPTLGRSQVFARVDLDSDGRLRYYMLTEIPPSVKYISKNLRNGTARRYRIGLPWTYLWLMARSSTTDPNETQWAIEEYKCFMAREQYADMDSRMIVARLPNIYRDGRICWGATGVSPHLPIAQRIDALTNGWYLSRFNSDLDSEAGLPQGEPTFARWVRETRANPMSWQQWPEFNDAARAITVRKLLENHTGTEADLNFPPIVLDGTIPEHSLPFTFGRWEEWWQNLSPQEVLRARVSLENVAETLAEVIEPVTDETPGDDGGEDIPYV